MLDTFENDMILSAVQQLTTEVQRVEGKANKIPINPEIPIPAIADAGKVLGVDESGNYVLVEGGGGGGEWTLLESFIRTLNLKNDTTWDSWTPSTTGSAIVPNDGVTVLKDYTFDPNTETIVAFFRTVVDYVYAENAEATSVPITTLITMVANAYGRAISTADIINDTNSGTNFLTDQISAGIKWYNASGLLSYADNGSVGLFGAYPQSGAGLSVSATIINNVGHCYIKQGAIYAKCSTATNNFPTSSYMLNLIK